MSSDGEGATHWPVGFRIRPSADPRSAHVEVSDTVSGRRFSWSADALARYLLNGTVHDASNGNGHTAWREALENARDRHELVASWRHWTERGWFPSDQYYMASRRWEYADTPDADGSVRTATVRRYLAQDGPPAEPEPPQGPRLALGRPAPPGQQSVAQLLVNRRTGRAYVPRPLPMTRLSGLLWHGLAEVRRYRDQTDPGQPLSYLESYGSAWEFYLCVYDIDGIQPGVYRYDIMAHDLASVRPGDHRAEMIAVLQGMHSPATAALTIGLIADFPRYQWRYRHEHGLRRLYIESGIIAQELVILGMSYGMSTLVTPAQRDRPYLELLDLPDDRFGPVYTLTMGLSRGAAGVLFEDQPGAAPQDGA